MPRVSAFHTILAGAYFFVAGVAVSDAMDSSRAWTLRDARTLLVALILIGFGGWTLRKLYLTQATERQAAP